MTRRTSTLWTFAITSLALFMVSLDNLVVTTAIPVIRTDLGASLEQLEWTVNAYTLTFAVFLLTGAALGDRFGRRRMFSLGLAIFTLGSVAAALAPSIEALNVARAVQGVGAAMLLPAALSLVATTYSGHQRAVALAVWGALGSAGVAIGVLLGGAITAVASWEWIFFVNVPIGIAVALSLPRVVRADEPRTGRGRFDLAGAASVMPACSATWPYSRSSSDRVSM